jgi:hypothetical protein
MNCHEHVKYLLYIVHGSREIADFQLGSGNTVEEQVLQYMGLQCRPAQC